MVEQPDTAMAAVVCEHYWAWVSPAGTGHAARLCQLCHAPNAAWLEEVAGALDAARAELDNCWQDRMEADQRTEAAEAGAKEILRLHIAAEARIGELERGNKVALAGIKIEEKRAEAAEAERDDFKQDSLAHLTMWQNKHAELQSAKARIAAALAILHDCHVTAEDMNRVRRALAGDVG